MLHQFEYRLLIDFIY